MTVRNASSGEHTNHSTAPSLMLSAPAAGYSLLEQAGGSPAGADDGSPPPQLAASAVTAPSTTAHGGGLRCMFIPAFAVPERRALEPLVARARRLRLASARTAPPKISPAPSHTEPSIPTPTVPSIRRPAIAAVLIRVAVDSVMTASS